MVDAFFFPSSCEEVALFSFFAGAVDGFAATDGFFFPSSCEERALFPLLADVADCFVAADDFFGPPPGEEWALFSLLADVVGGFVAAAFGGSACSPALSAPSGSIGAVCGSDMLLPCEDAEVGGGCSE